MFKNKENLSIIGVVITGLSIWGFIFFQIRDDLYRSVINDFDLLRVLINFGVLLAGYGGFKLLQGTGNIEKKKYHETFKKTLSGRVLYWFWLVPVVTAFFLFVVGYVFHVDRLVNLIVAGTVFVWIYLFFKMHVW